MQPPDRVGGLQVPQRADHVITEGVAGAEQGHERHRRPLTAPADQQLERLQLDRLVPVRQGAEQGDLRPGSRHSRGRAERRPPERHAPADGELEDPLLQRRVGADAEDAQRRDHLVLGRAGREAGGQGGKELLGAACQTVDRRGALRGAAGPEQRDQSSGRLGAPRQREGPARRGPHLPHRILEQRQQARRVLRLGQQRHQCTAPHPGVGVGEVLAQTRPERLGPRPEHRFGPMRGVGPAQSGEQNRHQRRDVGPSHQRGRRAEPFLGVEVVRRTRAR